VRAASLNSDQVVAAARTVVSERGLAAVSVRSVAAGLGVTPMALYRHIEDAQSLHARVVDACVLDLPVPIADEDPVTTYREWAVDTRLALLAYPGLGHHLLLHWFELPAMLGIVERLLELAQRLGFEEFEQVGVANAVFSFVLARVDLEESLRTGDALERELDSIARASETLPRLTAHLPEYERARVAEHFRFGLELMLDGITARAAQT
jgi:AcrR family transcriptional regulator